MIKHVTLRVLTDIPLTLEPVHKAVGMWPASRMIDWWVEPSEDGFWIHLFGAFEEEPPIVACSLQSHLHDYLGLEFYVACQAGECIEPAARDGLDAAALAARLLRKTVPVEPTSTRRDQGIRIFREALNANQLHTHMQPIVDMTSLAVVGYEMLARLRCPQTGQSVPTASWIPFVIDSHDSLRLATKMLEAATQWLVGSGAGYVSINLTATDVADPRIRQRLLAAGPEIRRISVIELTEWKDALAIRNITEILQELRDAGYRMALDDFGNGFSSLPMLRAVRFDIIKLDMSLVQSSLAADQHFISLVLNIASESGARVVAEGIETAELMDKTLRRGITYGQGFHLDAVARH